MLVDPGSCDEIRERTRKLVGDRVRPFHWKDEGPNKRAAMLHLLASIDLCVFATIHRPVTKHHQEIARHRCLTALVTAVRREGVGELLIESRGPQDSEDRQTLIELARTDDESGLAYRFANKEEPLLWLPDAIAGVLSDAERGKADRWLGDLQRSLAVIEIYRL